MTAPRRMGTENSETRRRLLDITERLMLREGYAAVGIRRVARGRGRAGAGSVLLPHARRPFPRRAAAARRSGTATAERQRRHRPLRSIWQVSSQPGAALLTEFMALANHREVLREELVAHAERYRKTQLEALTSKAFQSDLGDLGLNVPPLALLVATTSIARTIVLENALGLTYRHAEVEAVVEQLIQRLEGSPPPEPESEPQAGDRPDGT